MAPIGAAGSTNGKNGRMDPVFVDLWIYFNLVTNTILLPLLVATFLFSKRVKRHPTLVNVCITWIFSGVFSLLLFYAGQQKGPEPNKYLCIIQTALLYGITPMWSVAIFMMAYYVNATIDAGAESVVFGKTKMIFMLSAPYVTQCAFTITTLIIAMSHPDDVTRQRRVLYCALKFNRLSMAMALFTFLMCLGIMALKAQLAVNVYKSWRVAHKAGRPTAMHNLGLIVRVFIFGAYIFVGMIANIVTMARPSSPMPDVFAAAGGTVVFLIFGTQKDVFRAWCFWRSDTPQQVTPATHTRLPSVTSTKIDLTN